MEQGGHSADTAASADPGVGHAAGGAGTSAAAGPAAQPAPAIFGAHLEALHRESFRQPPQLEEGEVMVSFTHLGRPVSTQLPLRSRLRGLARLAGRWGSQRWVALSPSLQVDSLPCSTVQGLRGRMQPARGQRPPLPPACSWLSFSPGSVAAWTLFPCPTLS